MKYDRNELILMLSLNKFGKGRDNTELIEFFDSLEQEIKQLKSIINLEVQNFMHRVSLEEHEDKLKYLSRCIAEYRVRKGRKK